MKDDNNNKSDSLIYMDTYVLQQDMRIRLPKAILNNLNVNKGETKFQIFLDLQKKEIILRVDNSSTGDK